MTDMAPVSNDLLSLSLDAAVPLHILYLQLQGGPSDSDVERARAFSAILCAKGDELLYRSKKPGYTATLFNDLAEAIAVMAFQPAGIKVFGQHWKA